jgi:hypothetical protein
MLLCRIIFAIGIAVAVVATSATCSIMQQPQRSSNLLLAGVHLQHVRRWCRLWRTAVAAARRYGCRDHHFYLRQLQLRDVVKDTQCGVYLLLPLCKLRVMRRLLHLLVSRLRTISSRLGPGLSRPPRGLWFLT